MGAQKKSRIAPAQTKKGGERQNKHHYQGFHDRVATLTINPVQRARQQDERSTESYLKPRLEFWKDTNLSKNFVEFAREFDPLCDSLVQILHNEQRIFDLLNTYIAKNDEHSLEPFLDLLSKFAHDLGSRFEKFFATSLETITALVSHHQAIEVIEWSFNTLTWLFHYLSKLLIPDLRPTYDILSPLLGKQVRKEHVARFAAEVMSFLVRKAASKSRSDATSLETIVRHMLSDWITVRQTQANEDVYGYGLMNLFADAIKDVQRSYGIKLHGLPVYRLLLQESLRLGNVTIAAGVTTSLIHHTTATTFAGLLEVVLDQINEMGPGTEVGTLLQACDILYTVTAVRQGDRVANWNSVFDSTEALLKELSRRASAGIVYSNIPTLLIASVIQMSSFDSLISRVQTTVEELSDNNGLVDFPLFCLFAEKINGSRFHELIKPYMFRFMARNWQEGGTRLLFTARTLIHLDLKNTRAISDSTRSKYFKVWPEKIAHTFEHWRHTEQLVAQSDAMLDLADLLDSGSAVRQRTADALQALIKQSLDKPLSWSTMERKLFLGNGLSWYLAHHQAHRSQNTIAWTSLCVAQNEFGSMPAYLANMSQFLEEGSASDELDKLQYHTLIPNLSTDSRDLRLETLRLLNRAQQLASGKESEPLRIAIAIENTKNDHQNLRVITQQVARLPREYAASIDHPWIGKAIVYYLFGLLTIRLTPVWAETTDALKQIYDSGKGDGVQLLEDITFKWLETRHPTMTNSVTADEPSLPNGPVNGFQCTNARLWRYRSDRLAIDLSHAEARLEERFHDKHIQTQPIPFESAGQALRILFAIPALAERRSRRLVPLFLKWASADEDSEETLVGSVSPDTDSESAKSGLGRRDQKTMLDIFGLFNNPSVLHQSGEVYNALLRLLGNGDVKMQKAALKALLTWKLPAVRKFQEELNNLLDNARFREELVVFLPSQTDESGVSASQRHELMRVLLRLLYGRIIARGSAGAGRASQTARRRAVFEALGNFPQEDLTTFVEIVLGPLKHLALNDGAIITDDPTMQGQFPIRKQMGFVKLAKDLLESLGDKLEHMAAPLLNAILYCLANVKTVRDGPIEDEGGEEPVNMSSMQKAVRQGGLQCLLRCFKSFKNLDARAYANVIEPVVIRPRIGSQFAAENSQSVSSTMYLLSVWAAKANYKHMLLVNDHLLMNILDCLNVVSGLSGAKSEVKVFIFEQILKPFIAELDGALDLQLAQSRFYDTLLERAAGILEQRGAKPLLASAVSIILQVANTGAGKDGRESSGRWSSSLSARLVGVFSTLLALENQVVSGPTKSEALAVLAQFLPSLSIGDSAYLLSQLYMTLAKMFSTAKHPEMRLQLTKTFETAAGLVGEKALRIAALCSQLNSVSMGRLDEPDLDERDEALKTIFEASDFGDHEWTPLVYNALHFVKDEEELIIREHGVRILCRFVETNNGTEQSGDVIYPSSKLLRGVLLPALRRGVSERSELVRVGYLNVMAHLVKCCPQWSEINDMTALTTSSDESESFFEGVLHIQQDWRKRSLIKLARVSRQGQLGSNNTAHYLLPLVEQFVFDRADDNDAHSLSAQAVLTIGAMVSSLDWTQARKTLKRYSGIIKDKPELEKAVIRLIGVTTEAILASFRSDDETAVLKKSIPTGPELAHDVEKKLLPPLADFLRHKDENVVSLRVPIAVSAARLICILPEDLLEYKLAPVLTDVCNILRSQAQESRDLSRKTLSEIAALIGSSKFGFILKELRVALSRGKQLHVLSYTLHSLLVASDFKPGELDYCLPEIMRIVLDDTFGATGQEKDADGYTNKAKEVKGSKSLDTAERMAKITTVGHLEDFTSPIHRFLTEKLDARSTAKMDELLRRIRSGLEQNESIGTQESLVFCYKVLNTARVSANNARPAAKTLTRQEQQKKNTFEIQPKGAKKAPVLPRVSSQQYKFARFALDLLREILRRYESLRTTANLSGFLTPVGDILLDAQEEVQTSALRFLASIIKVSMPEWKDNVPVYADTAFRILQNQESTNTELSQAALKLLAAIIRDRTEVALKDKQLSWLIKAVIPDLRQPAAQGVTFNFFKAVIQRHIVTNEVYEAMDAIAKLFLTYSDGSARNQARSIWLQFVTTYEQSEKRFEKQIAFMTTNLVGYKHFEGRQSMMEAIDFLLRKLDRDHLQKAILAFFIPTMGRFIGDENANCRAMAGALLQTIFAKADPDSLQTMRKALHTFLGRDDKSAQTAALRMFVVFVEADSERAKKDLPAMLEALQTILADALQGDNSDWEPPCYALKLLSTLHDAYDSDVLSQKLQQLWTTVYQLASFPHAWVKVEAAKLTRSVFDALDGSLVSSSGTLKTSSGVKISHSDLCRLTRSYFRTMLRRDVQERLVAGLVQNLETLDKTVGDLTMINDFSAGEEDDAAEEESDDEEPDKELKSTQTLRGYSLSRISAIVRRESPLIAKLAALQLLASIVGRMPSDALGSVLLEVLWPLNHLTDLAISRTVQMDAQAREMQEKLGEQSNEIMTVLQRKLPEGAFVDAMHKVQKEARQRREERRGKRRIEAVADPEKYSKDKAKKRMKGRDRRQERNVIERSKRRGY